MHLSSVAKRGFVLVFLAFLILYFYGLGQLPLLGPDEPRYAQVAREMFLRSDWITPTLGGHLWFEKPALLYWMMIAGFKLFGVTETAARLGSAVSGLLTIFAVFWMARRVERAGETGEANGLAFWSTLAAGTTLGLIVFSRAASFDILVTMTTTWALAFFLVAEIERDKRRWLVGFYALVGVSLLAKGLVGFVIPFGVAGAYYLVRRRMPDRTIVTSLLWGLPLAAVVAAVWYAPVINRHGWPFIDQFFVQHHFARYVTVKYRHPAPVYFYLLIFVALALPWTAFAVDALVKTGKELWRRDESMQMAARHKFQIFSLVWICFPLIFFSFSGSKLPGYILPVVPAAALMAGTRLVVFNRERRSRWPILVTACICCLFAIAAMFYARQPAGFSMICASLVAAPLLATGVFGLLRSDRSHVFGLLVAGATVTAVLVILSCGAATAPAERESSKRLLKLADERGHSQAIIFGMQRDDRSPEFYAAGRVVYDQTGEPVMYEGPGQIVWESRRRQAKILAFVPLEDVNKFLELSSMRSDFVGDNGKFALVAAWPP